MSDTTCMSNQNWRHFDTSPTFPADDDGNDSNDADDAKQINQATTLQSIANTKSNKWTCRIERRRTMKLVINLGATSNFVATRRNELAKEREIEKRGVLTRQHHIASVVSDRTSIWATKQQSKRGGYPTRTKDLPRQCQQNSWRRIDHDLPSMRRRSNHQ